jgi:hypothetical protein
MYNGHSRSSVHDSMSNARASLHINMATVHILNNDIHQAEKCVLSALKISPTSIAGLKTLVYILLKKGNTSEALSVLRMGRYISSNSNSNSNSSNSNSNTSGINSNSNGVVNGTRS